MTQTQSDPTPAIPVGQAIGGALGQAQSVLAGPVTAGPVMGGQETVRTTDEGARLRAEIAGSISAVTAPIYESLTASDVETTVRTLRYLTTSVRSLNPAAPAGPAGPGASAEPGERS
jgi:hypothetical protein